MKQCMALITPYKWYEGFPMIIVESFSVGCPVLTSNIGNVANIVSISNGGVIFDFNEENSFENAMKECVVNNRALSLNAYQYYRNVLLKEKNYEVLNDIYAKLKIGGLTSDPKSFIFSGRLEENKGILSLLRMC